MNEPERSLRPPAAAVLIVPVWGQAYVQDFLRYSLPTLLSPGNLPAVAEAMPTKLLILTSADDAFAFKASKRFAGVAGVCETEVRAIDHLITDGNHSTTITLAMAEAVLSAGDAMLETCFFFLVSDYLVADGSLRNALQRVIDGASGVLVGNFQVKREAALPWLRQRLRSIDKAVPLRLDSRETIRWALQHLHPATVANIVNVGFNHNAHTNRLFWRVDEDTLLGRFYLRHPLCIRPETTAFQVGSSADYSFVPEMCPSGNVVAITDSDDYLAIEMQPEHHEGQMLRLGPLTPKLLGKTLSEWTTREHRSNVLDTHIFHAGDFWPASDGVTAQADVFIAETERYLRGRPRPCRGHRYWLGALTAFHTVLPAPLPPPLADHVVGTNASRSWRGWQWRWHYALLGRPPRLRPWAPDWADVHLLVREIDAMVAKRDEAVLFLGGRPSIYSIWTSQRRSRVHSVRSAALTSGHSELLEGLQGQVGLCMLHLDRRDLRKGRRLVDAIVPVLAPGGRIVVIAGFDHGNAHRLVELVPAELEILESHFVTRRRGQRIAQSGMSSVFRLLRSQPWFGVPLAVVGALPLLAISTSTNLLALRRSTRGSTGTLTSFVMVLGEPPGAAREGER